MSAAALRPSDAAVAGEPFVTATVPRAFTLTLSRSVEVAVPAGLQELPQSIAEHWYSKANGVSIYVPVKAAKAAPEKAADERPVLSVKKG